ncbi:MAG: hypothetical protein QM758_19465 [Armatimonas sp.]
MKRRRWHQGMFVVAGCYNILWGLYSTLDPQWLFRFAKLPLQNHPAIFSAMAMVVGLYGLVYFEVARAPERGFVLALVGLIGKGLGPIGMAMQILSGAWPWSMGVMCLTNDLIWWIPFALYLWDAWPHFKRTWKEEAP